jgi:hypothetical protein
MSAAAAAGIASVADGESAMDSAYPAALVRREVWRSLVSMLRVYAHAASLNYGEHSVTETDSDVVTLSHAGASLEINFHPEGGRAAWLLKAAAGGETGGILSLSPSGAIETENREVELDQIAIAWVSAVTRAGAAETRS